MLETVFGKISDSRRRAGLRYDLGHVLLFTTFAIMSGADGVRGVSRYISDHLADLKRVFGLHWKRAPAHNTLLSILSMLSAEEFERVFREWAQTVGAQIGGLGHIAFDGKVLRGSYDKWKGVPAFQILFAYSIENRLILGHIPINAKENEIEAVQALMVALSLEDYWATGDALHTQKKTI